METSHYMAGNFKSTHVTVTLQICTSNLRVHDPETHCLHFITRQCLSGMPEFCGDEKFNESLNKFKFNVISPGENLKRIMIPKYVL